ETPGALYQNLYAKLVTGWPESLSTTVSVTGLRSAARPLLVRSSSWPGAVPASHTEPVIKSTASVVSQGNIFARAPYVAKPFPSGRAFDLRHTHSLKPASLSACL